MSHATHHHRLHAPGKIYVFLLALAIFGAMARCAGPDFAPALGAGFAINIPPQPPGFGCEWPATPLYDLTGRRWICFTEPPAPPPAEPHSRASAY